MPSLVEIKRRDQEVPNPAFEKAMRKCMEQYALRLQMPMSIDRNLVETDKCVDGVYKIPSKILREPPTKCTILFLDKVVYERPIEELNYIYRTEIKPLIEQNTFNLGTQIAGEIIIDPNPVVE